MPYELFTDDLAAADAVRELFAAPLIAIDTETTPLPDFAEEPRAALDPFKSRVRLFQTYTPDTGCFLFDMFSVSPDVLMPLAASPWAAHNMKFDYKQCIRSGIADLDPVNQVLIKGRHLTYILIFTFSRQGQCLLGPFIFRSDIEEARFRFRTRNTNADLKSISLLDRLITGYFQNLGLGWIRLLQADHPEKE